METLNRAWVKVNPILKKLNTLFLIYIFLEKIQMHIVDAYSMHMTHV
jgi:hypothetical protein